MYVVWLVVVVVVVGGFDVGEPAEEYRRSSTLGPLGSDSRRTVSAVSRRVDPFALPPWLPRRCVTSPGLILGAGQISACAGTGTGAAVRCRAVVHHKRVKKERKNNAGSHYYCDYSSSYYYDGTDDENVAPADGRVCVDPLPSTPGGVCWLGWLHSPDANNDISLGTAVSDFTHGCEARLLHESRGTRERESVCQLD